MSVYTSKEIKMAIMITKKQLLKSTCSNYHQDINKNWPRFAWKMSLVDILKLGMKVEINITGLQFVLYAWDRASWRKYMINAQKRHDSLGDGYTAAVKEYIENSG